MSHTRIYVGRLNHRTRERDLEDLFSQYGKVVSCDIKNGLGFGFVEFDDYRDADDAVRALDGKEVDGSRITVEFSKSSRRGSSSSSSSSSNNRYGPPQRSEYRCIVDCLPRDMSWQDLKDHFRKVSEVIYADVWQDRGRGKGAVEFRTRDDMKKAIKELDATEVRGSKIYVDEDEDRYSRSSYSRGSRYSSRRRSSYSRSRSPPRRRSRRSRSPRSRSRSDSRDRKKSVSRSRSDSRDRKNRGRGKSPSPTKSLSPVPKGSVSPKGKRSPRFSSRSRSGSRDRDRSRGRSLSRSPPPHKRSRSPSPVDREAKRQKVEEQEDSAD